MGDASDAKKTGQRGSVRKRWKGRLAVVATFVGREEGTSVRGRGEARSALF